MSSILGYVAAGLVIGPWGLRLIHDIAQHHEIAEFGVVLLLFIIGLELQPTRLWVMRRSCSASAPPRSLCAPCCSDGAAWLLGLPTRDRAASSASAVALSSTPLVLQVLAERGQLKSQHGRAAFGILLFQDLAVLPVLAVLPLISPHGLDDADGNGRCGSILAEARRASWRSSSSAAACCCGPRCASSRGSR